MSEILDTDDGSNLDGDCTRRYLDEAEIKTSFMSEEIQRELADLGCDDIVTAVTHVESFTALGKEVILLSVKRKKDHLLIDRIKPTSNSFRCSYEMYEIIVNNISNFLSGILFGSIPLPSQSVSKLCTAGRMCAAGP